MSKVAVIMGSRSDLPVVEKAIDTLKSFGVAVDVRILSAHRTPEQAASYARDARGNGYQVIIAAAGKAAHLPGVLAAFTTLPVIGLPMKSSFLDGMDSLLSIAQMPTGVPVATVGVGAAENAALLALEIIAVADEALALRLDGFKKEMEQKVLSDDEEVRKGE